MTKLIIQNTYSWLVTEDTSVKSKLWKALRYKERGYFHNRAYKQRRWDGYTNFFDPEHGRFLTGLLPEVKMALRKWGVKYQTEDERKGFDFKWTEIDDQFLNQFRPKGHAPITLHDYQVDFINKIVQHKRGVIYSPTSSGKTFIMVGALHTMPRVPTLVLQNRKDLAVQNYEEIVKWGVPNVGTLWGGSVKPDMVTVATVQSIQKMAKLLPKIKVIIVDEIHDMMSKMPKAVYRSLPDCSVRVGLSATPFKFGEKDLVQKFFVKGFFGPVLKTDSTESGILTTKELQDRDILARSRCTFYPIDYPQIPYDIYQDAVTRGIAESFHFHDVVSTLAKQLTGRTLILVDRLAHGDALQSLIPGSLWVQGKDTAATRKEVIKQLQEAPGDIVGIATQQIFNTGINVFIHNLVNAAGGVADHLIVQRMGRGLRKKDDKEMLNYYDFIFNINDYLLKHSNKRLKVLTEQGHEIIIKDELDFF
jgi:superfamily II DNA or RNA helicase